MMFILVVIFNLGTTPTLLIPFETPGDCQFAAIRFAKDPYVHSAFCVQK